jgi:hypothetical protein
VSGRGHGCDEPLLDVDDGQERCGRIETHGGEV